MNLEKPRLFYDGVRIGGLQQVNYDFPFSSPDLDPDGISYEIMRWDDNSSMSQALAGEIKASSRKFDVLVSPKGRCFSWSNRRK